MGHKRLKSGGKKKADIPEEIIDMMNEGLDELMDLLAGEESDLFNSPGERAGHFFSEYHKYRKQMNRPRQCVFPGCKKSRLQPHMLFSAPAHCNSLQKISMFSRPGSISRVDAY